MCSTILALRQVNRQTTSFCYFVYMTGSGLNPVRFNILSK